MLKKNRNRFSLFIILIVFAFQYLGHLANPRYKHDFYTRDISFDVFSYYIYLPATFIYKDIGIKDHTWIQHLFEKYKPSGTLYQVYKLDNGNHTPNYTCGFALLYSPFFVVGHLSAKLFNYTQDGMSFPYQFSISNGIYIYLLIGLFYLRKVLLEYFNDIISGISILIITWGTNFLSEAVNNQLQPHVMLFSGYAILIYQTIQWHKHNQIRNIAVAGFVIGLMVLARPSEIVCILIPMLWNIHDKNSFNEKVNLIRKKYKHILALILFAFIPFIPQIIYWKIVTGSYIFFSYQHTEGFDFLSPHILKVLFSFKKSLFVYTPMLVFVVLGIIILKRKKGSIFLPVLIYTVANFYLLSSWAAWWNGGSFGMRYFTESYVLMSLPLGFFLQWMMERRLYLKLFFTTLILFFFILNVFQTWQFLNWIIPDDRMTLPYYKAIFFKTKVTPEDRKLMEIERSYNSSEEFTNPQDYRQFTLAYYDFEKLNATPIDITKLDTNIFLSPPCSYRMGAGDEYSPTFKIRYDHLVKPDRDHVWLKVSVNYFSDEEIEKNPASIVILMPHKKYQLKYRGFDFEKYPSKKREWNTITAFYMTPFPYNEKDEFLIYIYHRGKSNLYLDNFRIDVYESNEPKQFTF